MRFAGTELIINQRHYLINKVERCSSTEGWASYQVSDMRTHLQFRITEIAGTRAMLALARQKAERLAGLRLYGLPLIYDTSLSEESLFVVTDSIQGYTLKEYLSYRGGPASRDLVLMVEYGRRLCGILSRLHPTFIHRALTPENILISENRVQLTDLGFSFLPSGIEREDHPYRAPEQRVKSSAEIGCWTDVYGFGIILSEMLTGERSHPIDPGLGKRVGGGKRLIDWQDIPGELKEIVVQCTQEMKDCRPKTIEEVRRRLSTWLLIRKGEELALSRSDSYNGGCGCYPSGSLGFPGSIGRSGDRPVVPGERGYANQKIGHQKLAAATVRGPDGVFGLLPKGSASFSKRILPTVRECGEVVKRILSAMPVVQNLKRLAGKRGTWVALVLLAALQAALWNAVQPSSHSVAIVTTQAVLVEVDSVSEWKAQFDQLSKKLREFEFLANSYRSAKVPGSPEKTAQNFRAIERKAAVLRTAILESVIIGKDLGDIAAIEVKMLDELIRASDSFAGYLEGERRTTEFVDWVEEAGEHYWQAIHTKNEAKERLESAKPPRKTRALQ